MKKAWLCDYCKRAGTEDEIKDHEDCCIFNPKNKACYTCMYSDDNVFHGGFYKECKKDLNIEHGTNDGDCIEWEWEDNIMNGKRLKIQ